MRYGFFFVFLPLETEFWILNCKILVCKKINRHNLNPE